MQYFFFLLLLPLPSPDPLLQHPLYLSYTVHKMGLILRSIERMLKKQFSMARVSLRSKRYADMT